jgi:hypothetical protein
VLALIDRNIWTAFSGGIIGAGAGVVLGWIAGAVSFSIAALLQPARGDLDCSLQQAVALATRLALPGVVVGTLCGASISCVFWWITTMPNSNGLSRPEVLAGHLWCSAILSCIACGGISGFIVGFFTGAIPCGTRRRENLSWKAVTNRLSPDRVNF